MKNKNLIYLLLAIVFVSIIASSCKKDDNNNNNPATSVPVLTTTTVSSITSNGASCGGNITSNGGSSVTVRGVCWSTNATPTISDSKTSDGIGNGSYSSTLTGLNQTTLYYVRAYATNSSGTGYGNILSFTTSTQPTVTDIDGNNYHTVTIGTQVWMVENLNVTKYRNGDPITNANKDSLWKIIKTGAYCDYNNQPSNSIIYGKLYNGYAVIDNRNIAPTGWHVATHEDWQTLTAYVGGESIAGGKLKETGTTHWDSPNTNATNAYGFTALPGGLRTDKGAYNMITNSGEWWTSTKNGSTGCYRWEMLCNYANASESSYINESGFHVRCIKD